MLGWRSLSTGNEQVVDLQVQDLDGRAVLDQSGRFDGPRGDNPDPIAVPSPDGSLLFVAAGDGSGQLYDRDGTLLGYVSLDELSSGETFEACTQSGPPLYFYTVRPRITAAAFAPDNSVLAVAYFTYEGLVLLAFFDRTSGGELSLDVEATVCFPPDSDDGRPYGLSAERRAASRLVGRSPVEALRFSPDGRGLVAASLEGGGAIYALGDTGTDSERRYRRIAPLESVNDRYIGVAWDRHGRALTASADGTLKRWEVPTRTFADALPVETDQGRWDRNCRTQTGAGLCIDTSPKETVLLRDAQGALLAQTYYMPLFSSRGSYVLLPFRTPPHGATIARR